MPDCPACGEFSWTDHGHRCPEPRMRLSGMPLALVLGVALWLVVLALVWLVLS